jgi:hypothetical protein
MSEWIHAAFRGRAVATFIGPAAMLPVLSRQMDGSTLKRRMARWATPSLAGLSPAILPDERRERAKTMIEGGRRVAQMRSKSVDGWVVTWPTADRARRQYAVGIDSTGSPGIFVKGSTTVADRDLLRTEFEALERLQTSPLRTWRTPAPLSFETVGDTTVLMTECVPDHRVSLRLGQIMTRLPVAAARASGGILVGRQFLGWDDLIEQADGSDTFRALLRTSGPNHYRSSLCHGDVQRSNAVIAGGTAWLVDWENSTPSAPYGTDVVVAELKSNKWQWWCRLQPPLRAAELIRRCLRRGIDPPSVALAVAYRQQVGDEEARRLAHERW